MRVIRCIKTDFKRLFGNIHFALAIIGMTVFTLLCFLSGEDMGLDLSVLYYAVNGTLGHMYLLVFPLAFLTFGSVFIEDMENSYFIQQIEHQSLIEYVLSKSIVVYLSSICSVILSFFAASCLLGIVKPWKPDDSIMYLADTCWGNLFRDGIVLLYDLAMGIQFGLLGGLLSMIGLLFSVIVKDRIFSAVSCVISCMAIQFVFSIADKKGVTFLTYFYASENYMRWGKYWLIKCIGMSALSYLVCTILIYFFLVRRLRHD